MVRLRSPQVLRVYGSIRYGSFMRLLLQKVLEAAVQVDGNVIGSIKEGYLLYLGVMKGDTQKEVEWIADKVASLRLYPQGEKDNAIDIIEQRGRILVVSQFTLGADIRNGKRPDYIHAANSMEAEPFYEHFIECLRKKSIQVATGQFGARMQVISVNDGPYTLWIEKKPETAHTT